MTRLTLERGSFIRVYEATWITEIAQFLSWIRDCGLRFEQEYRESKDERLA